MMSLLYLFQALSFAYIAFLAGKLACEHLGIASKETRIKKTVYAIGIGYGIIGNFGLILALLGLYKPFFFYALTLGIVLLSRKTLEARYRSLKEGFRDKRTWHAVKNWYADYALIKIIITAWVLIYAAISLVPSAMGSDGLAYHLPFSMEIIDTGSISFPVKNNYNYGHLPLFTEILYGAPIMLFQNFISFKIIQFSAYLLLLLLVVDFLKKYVRNRLFAWVGLALLLATMPLAKSALDGGMVDIFTAFFGLAAILALVELAATREKTENTRKILLVSGIFLGLALSTKYIALFPAVICSLLVLFYHLRNKEKFSAIVSACMLYAVPVIMLCGFWYVKNIIYMGNPFFPFFSSYGKEFVGLVNDFILERTLPNFFIFPFSFFGKEGIFTLPYAMLTAASFFGMYAMMAFLFVKRKLTTLEILLFLSIESYLSFLFFFSHIVRFAVPILVLTALLIALLLNKMTANLRSPARLTWYAGIIAGVLFAVSMASTTLHKDLSCLLGFTSPEACLYKILETPLAPTNYISQHMRDETVLEYWNIYYSFYLENNNRYSRFYCPDENETDALIEQCLKKHDIAYLVDNTRSREWFRTYPNADHGKEKLRIVDYFLRHGTVLYDLFDEKRNTSIRLYRLNR